MMFSFLRKLRSCETVESVRRDNLIHTGDSPGTEMVQDEREKRGSNGVATKVSSSRELGLQKNSCLERRTRQDGQSGLHVACSSVLMIYTDKRNIQRALQADIPECEV